MYLQDVNVIAKEESFNVDYGSGLSVHKSQHTSAGRSRDDLRFSQRFQCFPSRYWKRAD